VIKTSLLCCALSSLFGCALAPSEIRADVGHESHATQHRPLAAHPTNYGRAVELGLTAHWERGPVSLDVSESYSLWGNDGSPAPRELFQAKVGYVIWHK
jgi:hypothetical protein